MSTPATTTPPPAPPPVVTPMMRVQRARVIARLRSQDPPVTWAKVAKHTGLSLATCKRILKQHEQSGDPDLQKSPMEWIEQRMHSLMVIMDEASETYAAAPAGSSTRVGALKLMEDASDKMFELAARAGFVPRYLGAVSFEQKMQQAFRAMGEVLRAHGATAEMLDAVLELAESRLGSGRPDVIEASVSAS